MKRLFVAAAAAASLILLTTAAGPGTAASTPSGQRSLGQSVLEPVYNDENAVQIGYIKQPEHVAQPVNSNPKAWAPFFYLVIYPVGSTAATTYCACTCRWTTAPLTGRESLPCGSDVSHRLRRRRDRSRPSDGLPGRVRLHIALEPTFVLFTPQGAADGAIN
jgi:hypothetical protein